MEVAPAIERQRSIADDDGMRWGSGQRDDELPGGARRLDLAKLISNAPSVPLTEQVRINQQKLVEYLDSEIEWSEDSDRARDAAAALRALTRNAKEIPLTDDIRFDGTEALRLLAQIRGDFTR